MKTFYSILIILVIQVSLLVSQTIDNTFHELLPLRPSKVECIKVLSEGKLLLGGDISFFKNQRVNNLIRLNSDSTLDETFNFTGSNLLLITRIEFQSSGNIIVLARRYNTLTDSYLPGNSLFQLEPDGKILSQIDSLQSPNSITIQEDNKILVCGMSNLGGFLYRYNSDLSADTAFNTRLSFNNEVTDVKANHNNLFVAGQFSLVNGRLYNDIIKLDFDGKIDTTFNTGEGTEDKIGSIALQHDGKVLIGKSYLNSFNGKQCRGIVRLSLKGELDTTFLPPFILNSMTSDLFLRDSFIYLADYCKIQSTYSSYILRFRLDGSLDTDFTPVKLEESGFNDFCLAFSQGKIIFNNSSTTGSKYGLSESDSSGNWIKSFAPEISRYGVISIGNYFNGKFVVAGDFMKINNVESYGIAMLDKNGIVEDSFILTNNLGSVIQLQVANDSNVYVSTGSSFFKLNKKGKIEQNFNFKQQTRLYEIWKFRVLENGNIIAADANAICRLLPDGEEDSSFNIGTGINVSSTGLDFDLQANKIIWGSLFDKYNGTNVHRLIRLNSDASLDTTFNIGAGPDGVVFITKVIKPTGLLVVGWFSNFNGIEVPHGIVKLSENGEIDQLFNENQKSIALDQTFMQLDAKLVQLDSLIFIKNRSKIISFNLDGTLNTIFTAPLSFLNVHDIITLKDSSQNSGGKKAGLTYNQRDFLFALGSFKKTENDDPSFVIKLDLGDNATSINSKISSRKFNGPQFKIYPNPAGEQLTINAENLNGTYRVTLFNLIGEKVLESNIKYSGSEVNKLVDIRSLQPGMYLITISSGSKTLFTNKLIKGYN